MANKPDDGGPAFPVLPQVTMADGQWSDETYPGMSLRDAFAKEAMVGLLGHEAVYWDPSSLSERSYEIADAMIRGRDK